MNTQMISIIVPVYQTKQYLPRCIESLLNQSISDYEIILVDDGSTDGSGKLCDEFARKDDRITVIHIENSGVSVARNIGIDAARGAFIGFVDSDDAIEPDMFQVLRELLITHGTDFAACGYYLHDERGKCKCVTAPLFPPLVSGEAALVALLKRQYYRGFLCNKLFRTEYFRPSGFDMRLDQSISVCEDLLMVYHSITKGAMLYYNARPLYHYYRRCGGLTQGFSEGRFTELTAYQKMMDIAYLSQRIKTLLQCRFAETSLQLLYSAKLGNSEERVQQLKKTAVLHTHTFLKCRDLSLFEKIRFLIKLYFPVLSMRVLQYIRNMALF